MNCPGSALLSSTGTGKRQFSPTASPTSSSPCSRLNPSFLWLRGPVPVVLETSPPRDVQLQWLHHQRVQSMSREYERGSGGDQGCMWSLARVGVPGTLGSWHREATGLDIARVSFIRVEGPGGLRAEVLLPTAADHATQPCPPLRGCLVSPNCRNKFSARQASNP